MWKFEHSFTTDAKAETIWNLYSNIDTWKEWDEFVHVELFDEFITGPNAETLGPQFGGEISQRIPYTVESLVRLARKIELEAV